MNDGEKPGQSLLSKPKTREGRVVSTHTMHAACLPGSCDLETRGDTEVGTAGPACLSLLNYVLHPFMCSFAGAWAPDSYRGALWTANPNRMY